MAAGFFGQRTGTLEELALVLLVLLILLLIAVGSLAWPFIRDRRDAKRKASGKESEVDKMSNVFDVEED